jgi:digeranylgeranylglycerophospholipid reductase
MRFINSDVVVVGAGPAGCLAAKTAASKGVHVILLEEHTEIGAPVHCAEGISINGLIAAGLEPVKPIVSQELPRARVFAPNRSYVTLKSPGETGYTLNRDEFDRALGERAVKAGAELLTSTKAKNVLKDEGVIVGVRAEQKGEPLEIRAKVVIGADGCSSIIRRSAGLSRWYSDVGICVQYQLGGLHLDDPEMAELYIGSNYAPGGYAWVFPKSGEVANVGLGVRRIHVEPAIEYLKRFIDSDPRFKGTKVLRRSGGITPVSGMLDKIVDDRLMLIGDAAGQLLPMSGSGVHSGVEAGKMAGIVAVEAIEEGDLSAARLSVYRTSFEKDWGKMISDSRKVVEMIDKFTDDDLNTLAGVVTSEDIFNLVNGTDVKRTLAKIVKRSPGKILKLVAAYMR